MFGSLSREPSRESVRTLGTTDEELAVLMHASQLGRTDIVQQAISSLKQILEDDQEVIKLISASREYQIDENVSGIGTPLHVASKHGHSDVVRALLNALADPTVVPEEGEFANKTAYAVANSDKILQTFHVYLFEQIAMGNNETLSNLLLSGISSDLKDNSQVDDSLLHWAASFANPTALRILCNDNGVNINVVNSSGQTPLHIAVKGTNQELIDTILELGGDPTIRDGEGKDCLDVCPMSEEDIASMKEKQAVKAAATDKSIQNLNGHAGDGGVTFQDDDDDDDDDNDASIEHENERLPLLVLWPPVQRQFRTGSECLVLSNEDILYLQISGDVTDIYPLLSWSGLMDTMDAHGISIQVKRSYMGSKIRLCVDPVACAGRHKYELRVCPELGIVITASDQTGLLYGNYALVQLLTLHTDVVKNKGVTTLSVPSVSIIDYPDVANRGVMWSYRKDARSSSSNMRSTIELLSKLRINQLYLVTDTEDGNGGELSTSIASKMYALDEVCRRHHVDLVPTVIINHSSQRISVDLLRNFSQKTIGLFLLLESEGVDEEASESLCYEACRSALSAVTLAGIRSVTMACSAYTRKMANPVVIAHRFDLTITDYKLDDLISPSLCTKPILCIQTTLGILAKTSQRVLDLGQNVSILPAIIDSDFMYPLVLAKYTCFLHAGFAWNRTGICDMLGDFVDSKILRETLSQFLFGAASEDVNDLLSSALDMLTTQRYLDVTDIPDNPEAPSSAGHNVAQDMFVTEKILWDLMKCDYQDINISPMPSKESFTEYLKVIRRAQSFFKYRVNDITKFLSDNDKNTNTKGDNGAIKSKESKLSIEIFEILSILHLLSALCRAIVLAYNVEEKQRKDRDTNPQISFLDVMKYLQPGTKSDTVNTLLEATDFCANIWKHRYDVLYFNTEDTEALGNIKQGNECLPKITKVNHRIFKKFSVKKYMISSQKLPVLSVMHVVGEKLPVSINTIMAKFFGSK